MDASDNPNRFGVPNLGELVPGALPKLMDPCLAVSFATNGQVEWRVLAQWAPHPLASRVKFRLGETGLSADTSRFAESLRRVKSNLERLIDG